MEVLNKYHLKDKRGDVFIGRGGPFGNPFSLEVFRNDRELVLELFTQYFLTQLANLTDYAKAVWEIPRDKNLICYCAPLLCHGNVIRDFLIYSKDCNDLKTAAKLYLKKFNYKSLPQLEGKTHINIYSKSLTELGRLTSNFTHTPFVHPTLGGFASMEAYWYYIGTGMCHEDLRPLYDFRAKALGRTLNKVSRNDFIELIIEGIELKVKQTPRLLELLKENNLPFKHYYFYGNPENCKVVKEGDGLLEKTYGRISRELGNSFKVIVAGSRSIKDPLFVINCICESKVRISEIVEGGAKGVDTIGFYHGKLNHIPVRTFSVTDAEWKASKGAGMQRNIDMGNYGEKAIVLIKDGSKGSTHMAKYMESLGKEVFVFNC